MQMKMTTLKKVSLDHDEYQDEKGKEIIKICMIIKWRN